MYQVVNNLSHQAGAHALRVGVDFIYNDDTITFPRSVRGSYTFSSLAELSCRVSTTTPASRRRLAKSVVSQTNPNIGVYVQDEWKVEPGPDPERRRALRPSVPGNDQHRHQQRLAAARVSRGRRSSRGAPSCAAAPGLFFDRFRCGRVANALLSAGNTTDLDNLRQMNISSFPDAGRGAGLPQHSARASCRPVTLVNLTTMDRDLQNAYSQAGERRGRAAARAPQHGQRGLPVRARAEPDHVDQSERADVRGRPAPTTDAARTRTTRTTASIHRSRIPITTACTSRSCSGPRNGGITGSAIRTRSR